MSDVRILIVADDPLARAGLANMLTSAPGCLVTGQVSSDDLADLLDIYRPDVIVWDIGWEASPESLARLRAALEQPGGIAQGAPPVAALLAAEDAAAEAWLAGARGVLPRDIEAERLIAALQALARGLAVLDPDFAAAIPETLAAGDRAPLLEDLTEREIEVLQLIAEGLANKAIALRLNISEHTVKFHISALMSKLGAQSRTDAVVRASRRGLLIL